MCAASPLPKPRILAFLEPYPEAEQVLRAGKRRAELEQMDWEAVVIETPGLTDAEHEVLDDLVTMAGHMGASITRLRAASFTDGVTKVYQSRIAQGIPIFSLKMCDIPARYHRWYARILLRPTHLQEMTKRLGSAVNIVPIPLFASSRHPVLLTPLFHITPHKVLGSFLAVLLAAALIEMLKYWMPDGFGDHARNTSLIFLVACGIVATSLGLISGVIACVTSFLVLNIFYIHPIYQIKINGPVDMVNLVIFLLAGLTLAIFGDKRLAINRAAQLRAERLYALLRIHRSTQYKQTKEEVLIELDKEIRQILDTSIVFFLPSLMHQRQLDPQLGETPELSHEAREALQACWEDDKPSGAGINYNEDNKWRFEPLSTAQSTLGVLAICIKSEQAYDRTFTALLSGIGDQVAIILERIDLEFIAEQSRLHQEREKLRSALLSSVSHDLKTPLASVIGSLSVYRSMEAHLDESQRKILISTALVEAQRLDGFITNILDMSKFESGQVQFKQEWFTPEMLVGALQKRMQNKLIGHPLKIQPMPEKVEILADMDLTLQACINVVDNAVKYAPNGKEIDVFWYTDGTQLLMAVRDYGPGIQSNQFEKVFDKYTRLSRQDTQVAGTGLGLPIARVILQGQKGGLTAANHPLGGAVFTFYFPQWRVIANTQVS